MAVEQIIEKIIQTKDAAQLRALDEMDLRRCLWRLDEYYYDMPFDALNHEQRVLYLCIALEDACQADTILNLEENGLMLRMPEVYDALMEIGALETASLVQAFINLLPENTFRDSKLPEWDWFFEDEERAEEIDNIDGEIADYPDGNMMYLYHRYVAKENVAEKLLLVE